MADYLKSHAIKQKVIDTLVDEEVDGSAFLALSADVLGVPPFSLKGGSISKVMKLVTQLTQPAPKPAEEAAAAQAKPRLTRITP